MVPATDSAPKIRSHWRWIGLALVTLLVEPGCARLRSFGHSDDRPAFGTVSSTLADKEATDTPRGDLYADLARAQGHVKGTAGSDQPALAAQPPTQLRSSDPVLSTRTASADPKAATPVAPIDLDSASSPTTTTANENAGPGLDALLSESRARLDGLTTYQVQMTHQERVANRLNPPEDVVLSIRRNPRAVRLEWIAGQNKGREVLYAADIKDGLMHVHMANSLIPQLSMAPDSPLAMRNSRHPITEAGYETIVQKMELAVKQQKAGDLSLGKIQLIGMETPEGWDHPCYKIERITPANETWLVYLDPANHLPAVVQATAGNGDLLERFAFQAPTFNREDLARADAFDPDARWGPPKGLFQRLARAGANNAKESDSR